MIKNLSFLIGTWISASPILFSLRYLNTRHQEKLVRRSYDLCIDGFQRSGNGFLQRLVKHANPSILISHHIHASQNVIRALRYKIPTVVLIRRPDESVASLCTWDSRMNIRLGLYAYNLYYRKLMKYRHLFLIAEFSATVDNPDNVIRELNQRFESHFELTNFSKADLEKFIEEKRKKIKKVPTQSPFPNEIKARQNEIHRKKIKTHPLFEKSLKVYNDFLGDDTNL